MNKLFSFIQKERLYLLILIFVLLVNMAIMMPAGGKGKAKSPGQKAVAEKVTPAPANTDQDILAKREKLESALRDNKPLALVVNLATLLILAVICLGLLLDTLLLVMRSEKKPIYISTYVPPGPVKWDLWDVAKVVILFFFFGYMLIMIESLLIFSFPIVKDHNFRMMLNSSILDTLAVIFIINFSVGEYKERLEVLGLSLKNFMKNVFYGIVGYLATIPILMAVVIATAILVTALKYTPPQQAVVQLFMKEESPRFLAYASFFAAIVGPMIEELFFRGFMYNALKKHTGILWAMMISASAFAALHAHAVGFLPIVVIGILLAYLYEKTGTLVASVTVHILHNASMVGFVFLLKQLNLN